jgi:hypothetical protein
LNLALNKTFEDFIHKKPPNLDNFDLSLIPETERPHPREKKLKYKRNLFEWKSLQNNTKNNRFIGI